MSFYSLWNQIKEDHEENIDKIVNVIQIGNNIDKNFWDNLIQLANNAEGLAAVLDISPEKIGTWPARIKDAAEKCRKNGLPDKQRLVMTGENPEIAPQGDATFSYPGDSRPAPYKG